MNCIKCGKPVHEGLSKCEYCGASVNSSINNNSNVKERLSLIDEMVFGNVTVSRINQESIASIENTLKSLEARLQSDTDDKEELLDKILKIDEALQNKYAFRPEIIEKKDDLHQIKTTSTIVDSLLSENPPETNLAAYKIRSSIEKQLKDHYKIPYVHKIGFVKSLDQAGTYIEFENAWERYSPITHNHEVSKSLSNQYRYLNKFVHESEDNDRLIAKKFPRKEDQVKYLYETLKLFRDNHLIWE